MILGEFEFDTLYQESSDEDSLTLIFTMTLLIGLIVFGSLIMINLIIAIIVSDIQSLAKAAKQQVLINKVLPCDDFQFLISDLYHFFKANHAVQVSSLLAVILRTIRRVTGRETKHKQVL